MHTRFVGVSLLVLAAAALPAAAQQKQASQPSPQQPATAAQAPPLTAQQQAWVNELQQIQQKLEAAKAKALQNTNLRAAQDSLGQDIKTAMEKVDPGLVGVAQRVQSMDEEAGKAQTNGDQKKLAELTQEAQQIQARFSKAQQEALQKNSDLAARVSAFEKQVQAKSDQFERENAALLKRYRELQEKLMASAGTPNRGR